MKVQMKLDANRINVRGTSEKIIEYDFTEQEITSLYNFMIDEKKKREERNFNTDYGTKETGGTYKKTYNAKTGKFEYSFEYDDFKFDSSSFFEDFFYKEREKAKYTHDKSKSSSSSSWSRGSTYSSKSSSTPDCFVTLGLKYPSTETEIKSAYRKLMVKCHPDKPGGSRELYDKVQAAYESCMRMK